TKNVTGIPATFVPAPLRHIAGHVVGAPRPETLILADRRQTGLSKITLLDDVFGDGARRRKIPLRDYRQTLAGEFRISGGLIPTDAAHGIVCLSGRIVARLPGGWPWPAACVPKQIHSLFPAKLLTIAN